MHKEGHKMKKYESPEIKITSVEASDIITVSYGSTPWLNAGFEW